ncbi:hypothetical protein F3Y22_tig00110378pilonHSYRG00042 [Hibiscus syriacus]|uniref:RNase H type-1 domain-containing protein n=1 Tax=Hibiscus syriacus TaxID=106335 RepID=A0A6A3ASH5_HIBSY|nr:hypothetical protein F3Y22_tig00110378pilonHSYRG00042 [Hibiscus syriacus]
MNTDGARDPKDGYRSCGGVARNDKGEWFTGFARAVGTCTVLEAELWGVLEGLSHAWNLDARQVIIELDNMEACKLVSQRQQKHTNPVILQHIQEWLNKGWEVSFNQVKSQANRQADNITKLVQKNDFLGRSYHSAPIAVHALLHEDMLDLVR